MRIFNWFYLFAFCVLALLIALLIGKKKKQRSDYFLIGYLFFNAAFFLGVFIYYEYSLVVFFHDTLFSSQAVVPFYSLYILSLLEPKFQMKKGYFLLFAPLAASGIYFLLFPETGFNQLTIEDMTYVLQLNTAPLYFKISSVVGLVLQPAISIFLLFKLKRYKAVMKQSCSNEDEIDYPWVRLLLLINLIGYIFIGIPATVWGNLFPEYFDILYKVVIALIACITIYAGYFGLRNTRIFVEIPIYKPEEADEGGGKGDCEGQNKDKYVRTTTSGDMAEEIKKQLIELLRDEQMFLNPKLSLLEVAQAAGYTTHIISEVLNIHMETSFYDFVNDLRVEEAKKKLTDGTLERETILAIALDSGFNSKSSFNRVFKQKTGHTPSQFAKQTS